MSAHWQAVREQAALTRARYASQQGEPEPASLPIEELAECVYLLTVYDDPTLQPTVRGQLDPYIRSIRLTPGLEARRRRFVIAHEIGHFVLHGLEGGIAIDDDLTLNERADGALTPDGTRVALYNTRERYEQDANLFALELLVPATRLWDAIQQPDWSESSLAEQFGVSLDVVRAQLVNVCFLQPLPASESTEQAEEALLLDPEQLAAIDAPTPTLVIAGPGTGKTRSIVAKYVSLVERGVDPAQILALTFSNKAAEEMRHRILQALARSHGDLAGRVDVTTFHAWGLNSLKSYGHHVGLAPDFRLLSPADLYILLRHHLTDLPLDAFKMLSAPGFYLPAIIGAIGRCKDELCTPARFRALAGAEAARLSEEAEGHLAAKRTKKAEREAERALRSASRLRELAAIYERYERLLQAENVVDYGDLIMRAVQALRQPGVAAAVHARYRVILVDEFQDINYASGVLVRLLDGGRGCVWAVGDPWQSIYHFRGASPANLQSFERVYPGATIRHLTRNYRSLQPILDASRALMVADPLAAQRPPQIAQRQAERPATVEEWVTDSVGDQYTAIARDIVGRVGAAPESGTVRYGDHAILCRKHQHAREMVRVLDAHGIPASLIGNLFDAEAVKDVLAIGTLARAGHDVSLLRALTIEEHALDSADLAALVRWAHENRESLQRAVHHPAAIARLSAAGQDALRRLRHLLASLAPLDDAWQAITHYLFARSEATRRHIRQAARGDHAAHRALATMGQLLQLARNFVEQAADDERDAAAFARYLRLLIEAGEVPQVAMDTVHGDAVQVMTAHAAKGLEFPIVYVPHLEEGQFPARGRPALVPAVPAMMHGAPVDESQEERYLLFVSMTRARDRLILTRGQREAEREIKRSSLLPGDGSPEGTPWPVVAVSPPSTPLPSHTTRLDDAPVTRHPVPASSLDTYAECPRRYLYQYGYQLYDDLSPYLRMHQAIADAVRDLLEAHGTGDLPHTEEGVTALVGRLFATHEMMELPYSEDYFEEALTHVRRVWQDLRSGELRASDVNRRVLVHRPGGTIEVRVDQVRQQEHAWQWIRTRSGRERDSDHLQRRIMLYALAYQAEHGTTSNLALHYTATGRVRPASPRQDVLERHTEKVDELLERMAAGDWHPEPGQQCATCSFNLICPV